MKIQNLVDIGNLRYIATGFFLSYFVSFQLEHTSTIAMSAITAAITYVYYIL